MPVKHLTDESIKSIVDEFKKDWLDDDTLDYQMIHIDTDSTCSLDTSCIGVFVMYKPPGYQWINVALYDSIGYLKCTSYRSHRIYLPHQYYVFTIHSLKYEIQGHPPIYFEPRRHILTTRRLFDSHERFAYLGSLISNIFGYGIGCFGIVPNKTQSSYKDKLITELSLLESNAYNVDYIDSTIPSLITYIITMQIDTQPSIHHQINKAKKIIITRYGHNLSSEAFFAFKELTAGVSMDIDKRPTFIEQRVRTYEEHPEIWGMIDDILHIVKTDVGLSSIMSPYNLVTKRILEYKTDDVELIRL